MNDEGVTTYYEEINQMSHGAAFLEKELGLTLTPHVLVSNLSFVLAITPNSLWPTSALTRGRPGTSTPSATARPLPRSGRTWALMALCSTGSYRPCISLALVATPDLMLPRHHHRIPQDTKAIWKAQQNLEFIWRPSKRKYAELVPPHLLPAG